MMHEEVKKYRELSGDTNPNTPISRIGGYLDGYEKALEQEPVLDKIRAEIEQLPSELTEDGRRMIRRSSVFRVIDKYKAESE